MPDEVECDWDDGNLRHLAVHGVTPSLTSGGGLLTVVFTLRNGKVRGITAFPATAA